MSNVRDVARQVSERASWMRIDTAAIDRWADGIDPAEIIPAPMPAELIFKGKPAAAARWALLVDCLNFFFWTPEGEPWTVEYRGRSWRRYPALVAALRRAIDRDAGWLSPQRWAGASADELEEVFAGRGRIPMFEDRVRILNETGRVLLSRFSGDVQNMAAQVDFAADRIALLVCDAFDSFRDIHSYRGLAVPILKRAQIFASDLADAMARNGGPAVTNREALTAFADYRVPQILRHLEILVLDSRLEQRIETGDPIAASSEEEVELRACTIRAVELMVQALSDRRGADKPAWMVDEYLWYHSHDAGVTNQHHKTVTWYY
ncbi:MAG TPA: queuosine salvage family protein [Phycisphaerae bacterium]|nr:queuosine salvage family protein [Phycisphaerae bacterium]